MTARKPRYLLIWQDNLLKDNPQVVTDYLGTGITVTPFGKSGQPNSVRLACVLLYGWRLLFRQYDCVIIPAIDFNWIWDPSPMRRWVRKFLARLLAFKPNGATPLARWLLSKKTVICVLDRYDTEVICKEYARLVGADVYLKTNLAVATQKAQSDCPPRLDFLPYWILSEYYPDSQNEKDVDLFYAASLNSEVRKLAKEEVASLQNAGLRVVVSTERLPVAKYLSFLQRSYLTLSPEGYGYHCFRHYEAMAAGSVPVINRPGKEYVTDLADKKNCLLYDARRPGDLLRVVKEALRNKSQLHDWGRNLRQFALAHHSLGAVGNFILDTLETGKPR
jgi:hypothetical protein